MKVLCCNINGGKKVHGLAEFINLKNKFQPDIIFILETLTSTSNSCKILEALHFEHSFIVDPTHCGAIWVCWNSKNIIV